MTKAAVIVETRPEYRVAALNACENAINFLDSSWVILHMESQPIMSIADYNHTMTDITFWEAIDADKILVFQHDSALLREGIDEFLEWDWVGAPWKFQEKGGNGGLSLRDRVKMIELLKIKPYNPNRDGNEDIFYSNNLHLVGGRVAPREVCRKFSCESIFELGTLGFHAIDSWLTPEQCKQIRNQSEVNQS